MPSCNARILGTEFTLASLKFHETVECGREASNKITIDDGDARLYICTPCAQRFRTKCSANSSWYGWFDGDYPPQALLKYSPRWYAALQTVEVAEVVEVVEANINDEEVEQIIQQIDMIHLESSTTSEVPQLSKKEILTQKIQDAISRVRACTAAKDKKGAIIAAKEEARLRVERLSLR